jgi:hypothetical protein
LHLFVIFDLIDLMNENEHVCRRRVVWQIPDCLFKVINFISKFISLFTNSESYINYLVLYIKHINQHFHVFEDRLLLSRKVLFHKQGLIKWYSQPHPHIPILHNPTNSMSNSPWTWTCSR